VGIDGRRGGGRAPRRDTSGPVATAPGAARGPWWAAPRRAAAFVALVTIVVFARSLANGFTYDEPLVLERAQGFLKSSDYWVLVTKDYFSASLEGTWRPFCTLTYMLDALVAFSPAVFKAQSILWHVGCAWLVMALARRLLPERHRRLAIVAGLAFALHPVTTETVDNASFREDSLVTFWTLATILLALRGRAWAALVTFALGLLSKESAVVAPVLLVLGRLARPGASRPTLRAVARELAPFAAVLAVYLAIRFGPMKTAGTYALYPGGSLAGTMRGMPAVWAHDLRLLVAPWPLLADYTGYFAFGAVPAATWAPALVVVLAYVAALVVAARRGQRALAFGLAWFAIALGPVSNFIPVPIPAAERFLTLPLVGIALAAAAATGVLLDRLSPRGARARGAVVVAGVVVLFVFAVLVNLRHGDWHDDATLWTRTVAVNPRACGAQSAVGGARLTSGIEERSPALLRDAADHERLALSLCADASDPARAAMFYTRLGGAEAMLNHLGPARAALERALALAPRDPLAAIWLGYVSSLAGDNGRAAVLLKYAIIDLGPPESDVSRIAQWYVDKL
jgi:protein O-mannosyl-transferase